jgi:tRNA pseudouridine32 synthase/23S rRNA pseudouridine746 synthase
VSSSSRDPFFYPLGASASAYPVPQVLLLSGADPHPLCVLAARELQQYLADQQEWKHSFGVPGDEEGRGIGKMFGVLVVQSPQFELGYLCAFSGKLAGTNQHTRFVPPVFDSLAEGSFLNKGMTRLSEMSAEIRAYEQSPVQHRAELTRLKEARRHYSISLQQQLFEQYHFLNEAGEEKSVSEMFRAALYKNPPAGAGECAGPKLLQYAFRKGMKPLAMTEFWWGRSPGSNTWKHGHFYQCCKEKCVPILDHMLSVTHYVSSE